jgi:hypothetical protein
VGHLAAAEAGRPYLVAFGKEPDHGSSWSVCSSA